MNTQRTIYLLTGSNVGNSSQLLEDAKSHINKIVGVVEEESIIYKTAPWGNTNQQHFLNQVLKISSSLMPEQLLHKLMQIELQMGRVRQEKWSPRTIDIDILFIGNLVLNSADLIVPHPLLHKRRFTLIPLAQIAGSLIHPVFNQSINQLLQLCDDNSEVEKL